MTPIRQAVALAIVALLILVVLVVVSWLIGDYARAKKIIEAISAIAYVILIVVPLVIFFYVNKQ